MPESRIANQNFAEARGKAPRKGRRAFRWMLRISIGAFFALVCLVAIVPGLSDSLLKWNYKRAAGTWPTDRSALESKLFFCGEVRLTGKFEFWGGSIDTMEDPNYYWVAYHVWTGPKRAFNVKYDKLDSVADVVWPFGSDIITDLE